MPILAVVGAERLKMISALNPGFCCNTKLTKGLRISQESKCSGLAKTRLYPAVYQRNYPVFKQIFFQ